MKSTLILSLAAASAYPVLVSAAPARPDDDLSARSGPRRFRYDSELYVRNPAAGGGPFVSAVDNAVKATTGYVTGTLDKPAPRLGRHPQLQKVMNDLAKNTYTVNSQKRDLLDYLAELSARDYDDELYVRNPPGGSSAGATGGKVAKAVESWLLSPKGQTDRDQRQENKHNAVTIATGYATGTLDKPAPRTGRHPELQKVMNDAAKNTYRPGQKRDLLDYFAELSAREYDDELYVRTPPGGSSAGATGGRVASAVESWLLSPKGQTDRDQRQENKHNAVTIATGYATGTLDKPAPRTGRHPELQKVMNDAAKNTYRPGQKRALLDYFAELSARDYDDELYVRTPPGGSSAGSTGSRILNAAEKWVLNPSGMADHDQRKENRNNAVAVATGYVTGTLDKPAITTGRHPELNKIMNEAHQNTVTIDKHQKREFYDEELY